MTKDYRRELQGLLRRLFQFDSADLDFGIYRIMNYKRDEIEKFIEEDLIKAVDVEFEKYSAKSKAEIEKELEEITKRISSTLGEDALLPSGDIKEMYRGSPIAKEFYKKKEDLKNGEMADQHKSEIFSHIYQFFSRYYDEGDFISQRRYSRQNKYAVPYNGEEVLLHWANKDQYYIKTGEYFKNYSFKIGDYTVNFKLADAEIDQNQNNNRIGNRFFLLKDFPENIAYDESAKELTIFFDYRDLTNEEKEKYGTRDIQNKILNEIQETILLKMDTKGLIEAFGKQVGERTVLDTYLFRYAKRNTTDYFIHKDLNGFLTGELDFYIKNEVLILDDLDSEKGTDIERYINRIKVIKAISRKIIDFLAQIENFQKKLFEKKKIVIKSDYCMTLDKVPEALYAEIAQNADQIGEWKRVFKLDETVQGTLAQYSSNSIDVEYLKSHPYLVLDTKFYSEDFKDKLLASFSDLDSEIGGYMIKSENFQALNLFKDKFQGKIKCIYIDPPYNTGNNEFIYKDNYQHSSWLSMMEQRLAMSRDFLSNDGVIFVSIDDNEESNLRSLLNVTFGSENFVSTIVWQKKYSRDNRPVMGTVHDYIRVFAKNINEFAAVRRKVPPDKESLEVYRNPNNDPRGRWRPIPMTAQAGHATPSQFYEVKTPSGVIHKPSPGRCWGLSESTYKDLLSQGRIWFGANGDGQPNIIRYLSEIEGFVPWTWWPHQETGHTDEAKKEIYEFLGKGSPFDTPKPTRLLYKILYISTLAREFVLDFFAGSGSTAHATINLNKEDGGIRKYILVEMGDYFDTVMVPRIQRVMFSKDWQDGKPTSSDGTSHIFKYTYLEQYEDTLNNIEFLGKNRTSQSTLRDLDGYFIRYMLDFETRDSPCRINMDKLKHPFDYELKIIAHNEIHNQKIDLVDTFNLLLGIYIKEIKIYDNNGSYYKAILGTKNEETITIIWRTTEGLDLEADKKFIEDHILKKFRATKVYVNSDCFVEGVIPIEPEFKRLMGA